MAAARREGGARFEVEPVLMEDAEEDRMPVKPLPSKHPAKNKRFHWREWLLHERAEAAVVHQ